ncbi:MAG: cysteine desulfurase [Candidatus Aenigmatarchaeota archaeon]|nr:MAG: cysteine desulfurase [Candidatus Aenigmarchaeota archaeon]
MMDKVYLDNAATTRVDSEVLKAMEPYFTKDFGNMASLHSCGREAEHAVEKARRDISKKVNGKDHKLVFTSGGTESNNFTLKGVAFANRDKGKHIITTKIEHECILNAAKWLEKQGFDVTYLPVNKEGFVELDVFSDAIRKDTVLASIIHANNEIGTIEPIRELGKIAHDHNVLLHTDACQSFTKVPIDLKKDNIDLMTINSPKIHGPKGAGGLFIRQGVKMEPLLHGGGQEFGYRSGTVNVSGIVGFAKAVDIMKDKHLKHMEKIRDMLIDGATDIPESWLNGPRGKDRLANNAHFSFRHIEGESLIVHLDLKGIAASTGSACSSKSLEPSHVLMAIGLQPEDAHGSIRFSVGKENTKEEIEYTLRSLHEAVETLRKMSPLK